MAINQCFCHIFKQICFAGPVFSDKTVCAFTLVKVNVKIQTRISLFCIETVDHFYTPVFREGGFRFAAPTLLTDLFSVKVGFASLHPPC